MNLIQKRTEQKDSAVSPVVGVMLMLVVTIIIAAVVASFAGGLVTNTEAAPVASLDVNIYSADYLQMSAAYSGNYAPDFTIDHLGGDSLNTADLKLVFHWTNKTTSESYTATYTYGNATGVRPITYESVDYQGNLTNGSTGSALYVNDKNYASSTTQWGNVTISTGDHVQTFANYLTMTVDHTGSPFMDALFGSGVMDETGYTESTNSGLPTCTYSGGVMDGWLTKGNAVQVTILHVPSGQAIYDKEVYVQ